MKEAFCQHQLLMKQQAPYDMTQLSVDPILAVLYTF